MSHSLTASTFEKPQVAVIGAGELGGALAHVLARRDVAAEIRLIDPAGSIAAGKALDIMHAAPIEGFATRVSGSTDPFTAAGARVIAFADPSAPDQSGADTRMLLKQLSSAAPRSVFVCAGSDGRELVEWAANDLRLARTRLAGSAPEAFAAAVRALIAVDVNGSPRDVSLTVLGIPPNRVVVSWEDATINGLAAAHVLNEPMRRRIVARLEPLWPPGPYALANAAAEVTAALLGRSRRTLCCFVAPDRSQGRKARTVALPVRFDERGVVPVDLPPLSARARVELENAMLL